MATRLTPTGSGHRHDFSIGSSVSGASSNSRPNSPGLNNQNGDDTYAGTSSMSMTPAAEVSQLKRRNSSRSSIGNLADGNNATLANDNDAAIPMSASSHLNWIPSPTTASPRNFYASRHARDPSADLGQFTLGHSRLQSTEVRLQRPLSSADMYGETGIANRQSHSADNTMHISAGADDSHRTIQEVQPGSYASASRHTLLPTWSQVSLHDDPFLNDNGNAEAISLSSRTLQEMPSQQRSPKGKARQTETLKYSYQGEMVRASSSSSSAYEATSFPIGNASSGMQSDAVRSTDVEYGPRTLSGSFRSGQDAGEIRQGNKRSNTFSSAVPVSGLSRNRSVLESARRGLQRLSVRVVNLKQTAIADQYAHIRLPDGESDSDDSSDEKQQNAGQATRAPPVLNPPVPEQPSLSGKQHLHEDAASEKYTVGWEIDREALRGKTLGLFYPSHPLRRASLAVLIWAWTEPCILALIVANIVVLTIQAAPSTYIYPVYRGPGYFHTWEDYALFVLFSIFTVEMAMRVVVSGFIFDPYDDSQDSLQGPISSRFNFRVGGSRWWVRRIWQNTRTWISYKLSGETGNRTISSRDNFEQNTHGRPRRTSSTISVLDDMQRPHRADSRNARNDAPITSPSYPPVPLSAPSTIKSFSSKRGLLTAASMPGSLKVARNDRLHEDVPFIRAVQAQQDQHLQHTRAYLRHSWNRVDFVAVCSFWLCFILAVTGVEGNKHVYLFRALSTLRAARLLVITTGTTTILRSLKQSAPMMVNVAFFVVFAMVLFSIIGVQSFRGSFKRMCTWVDPVNNVASYSTSQLCGGHIDPFTRLPNSFIDASNMSSGIAVKGFICPLGQICLEQANPFNNTQSFDNVFASLLQVVVIMSSNTWTSLMYNIMDAEYFLSSLFFVVCLVLLNIWLVNIFVAVIINTFGNIREETRHSAFAGKDASTVVDDNKEPQKNSRRKQAYFWRRMVDRGSYVWIALVIVDVGIQASKTADDSPQRIQLLNNLELYFTLAFFVELAIRFMSYLPDWRAFNARASNLADSILAISTCVLQIPAIHNSAIYPWLTVLQLMRFYRVILAVPRMRKLLAKILSSVAGLLNMLLFLLLINFLVAVIAVQFLRGDIPAASDGESIEWSFYQIYNAFLTIYVIFSSENWTTPLYNALGFEASFNQAVISAIFISGWFMFANFILLQMFIAVINEGFAVAEEEKQKAQLEAFSKKNEPAKPNASWISRLNPYRFLRSNQQASAAHTGLKPNPQDSGHRLQPSSVSDSPKGQRHLRRDRIPFDAVGGQDSIISTVKHAIRKRRLNLEMEDDVDKQLHLLSFNAPPVLSRSQTMVEELQAKQAVFIDAHPSYDRSLWIFSNQNFVRKVCQRIVEPPFGSRVNGVRPYRTWTAIFKIAILATIIASVAVAAIATPVYRRAYFVENRHIRLTWFNLTESALGFIFIIEFLVKVIADGFIFTPNAYLLSIWNLLDLFVLITLVIDISTSLSTSNAALNRFVRSLKAFRALRLINLSATMRDTFYNVMIVGASRILDASVLTILYIIPFSVWGQNLFSGLLYSCNDSSALTKAQCSGEYLARPAEWAFLMPRAWQNPYVWSFDSFRSAFLILFEIVSLEGWTAVMASAMGIIGRDQQPQQDAAQYNSIFFLIYNLIGAIVVLTLFVSVIIENFGLRSGMALLTSEQRQWIDLKKLLVRQRPAKQPIHRPEGSIGAWCYDRSVDKHGWWSRCMTFLYLIHIAVLMSQTDSQPDWADEMRDWIFLIFTLVYATDIGIRFTGLGWKSFSQNGWNLYDIFVVTGTFATTIPIILGTSSQTAIQLQKLFLVSIAFKLVQKNNSLNQLFKTAITSLPAIMSIFGLWLTLFLVWAIFFLENFSLTRWSVNETWRQNYSTLPKTMLMLTLMSTGEGWNAYMHDYTLDSPDCSPSDSYLFTDCGSPGYAFTLFITWNILSMYIFLNMITGVVVENFSFVFSLYGRTVSVSREEMRRYKKAWAMFDRYRNGHIRRNDFIPFFKNLSGVFEVGVYPQQLRLRNLRTVATSKALESISTTRNELVEGLDLVELARRLDTVDSKELADRKRLFNRLYHEALLCETSRGIPFTDMLLLLAHHKLIDVNKSLGMEELLHRQARMDTVDDLVSLERIRGLLSTVFWRRRFLQHRAEAARQRAIPAIVLAREPDELHEDEDDAVFRHQSTREMRDEDGGGTADLLSPPL